MQASKILHVYKYRRLKIGFHWNFWMIIEAPRTLLVEAFMQKEGLHNIPNRAGMR